MGSRDSYGRDATDQRGSLLVGTLLFVSALTILGFLLYQAAVVETKAVGVTEADARARYAAESGLNRAALDVAWDNTQVLGTLSFSGLKCTGLAGCLPSDTTTVVPLTGYGSTCFGSTSCDASHNPNSPAYVVQAMNHPDTDKFWLISTACIPGPAANPCPAGSREAAQVRALIMQGLGKGFGGGLQSIAPPNDLAGCGGTTVCLRVSGGTADSYKSGTCPDSSNLLYSNGNIDITGGTINGNVTGAANVLKDTTDVSVKPGSVTGDVYSGGTISPAGSQYHPNTADLAQYTGEVLPDCAYTPFDTSNVKVVEMTKEGEKEISVATVYDPSTHVLTILNDNVTVTLLGGNYCLGGIDIKAGTLAVGLPGQSPPPRAIVVVNGQVTMLQGQLVNNTFIPDNFQLVSTYGNNVDGNGNPTSETGSGIQLHGTNMYMTVYAPTTSVVLTASSTFSGAIAGKFVTMMAGATFHFDQCLANDSNLAYGPHKCAPSQPCPPGGTGSYSLLSWQRCHQTWTGWSCT